MNVENITRNSEIFDNLNVLIANDFNPRFLEFLDAINSSELLKQAALNFQAMNGRIENNSNMTDSAVNRDPSLRFSSEKNAILLPDDYLIALPKEQQSLDSPSSTANRQFSCFSVVHPNRINNLAELR